MICGREIFRQSHIGLDVNMESCFLESAHHVETVLYDLSHCHLITFEDAFDLLSFVDAEGVLLGRAHCHNFTLGLGSYAINECLVREYKFLQNGSVVQNLFLEPTG